MNNTTPFVERLVEASLDGQPLPQPENETEHAELQQFLATQALFEEVREAPLSHAWTDRVWDRIAEDEGENNVVEFPLGTAAPSTPPAPEAEPAARRIWPVVLLAAAAALLLYVAVGQQGEQAESHQAAATPVQETVARSMPAEGEVVVAEAAVGEEVPEETERSNGEAPRDTGTTVPSSRTVTLSIKTRPEQDAIAIEGIPDAQAGAHTIDLERPGYWGDEGRLAKNTEGDGSALPPSVVAAGSGSSAAPLGGLLDEDADGDWGSASGLSLGGRWDGKGKDDGWRPEARVQPKPRLTAGETNDNDTFDAFQKFLAERPKPYLEEMDVSERMFIRVLDAKNRPMPNTLVTFKSQGQAIFTGKTYADGSVLFHPRSFAAAAQAQSFDLTFQHGTTALDYTIKRGAKESWEVRMPLERSLPARPQVDVVFLLDTTGSMGDEIERLQQTILQISDQVESLPGNPEARLGLVLYRDDSEAYVSQLHDFTSDVNTFKRTLSAVTADGGGDTPERLEVGLHRTVHEMSWGAQSTRLVFLVADAPPHRADQNEHSYARDIQAAVGKGIKVYPVASSGLNDDGEYVLRQLAQYTMAKFLFLTYGASGTFTPHDIPKDSFQPTTLDGLIIKIIRSEVEALELAKGGASQQ